MNNLKIGDTVEIINWGGSYGQYEYMAKEMNLKNWVRGYYYYSNITYTGKIICIRNHPNSNKEICGIRLKNGVDIIINMGSKYLKYLKSDVCLPDELFTI